MAIRRRRACAVWLCYRFFLSYRDVEELLAARGIVLTHETIRRAAEKLFGKLLGGVSIRPATHHVAPHRVRLESVRWLGI